MINTTRKRKCTNRRSTKRGGSKGKFNKNGKPENPGKYMVWGVTEKAPKQSNPGRPSKSKVNGAAKAMTPKK
jgi:hypothetical protein